MAHKVTIPLTDDFYDEVEDAFIDRPITAQKFIFDLIKVMCKDAKAGKLNKSCSINIIENGAVKQEFVKLKEVNLEDYKLSSNPEWLPQDMDKDSVRKWEHNVTDKTMEYLELFCKFVGLRFKRYNESISKIAADKTVKLREELEIAPENTKEILAKQLEEFVKATVEGDKKTQESIPKCIEECIYSQIYPKLHEEVMKNMDTEFDKEFEEMYPSKQKVASTPPPPPPPGSRVQPR